MTWQTRWLTERFGIGPFAYGAKLERQLRAEIPLAEFSKLIHEQLLDLEDRLPSNTVAWLYELSLRAIAEKKTVELARRTMRTKAWQQSQSKMYRLLRLLDAYQTFDLERALRKAIGSRKDSRTANRAAQLSRNLRDLKYQFTQWSDFARWGSWRKDYRDYLVSMDKHLKRRLPISLEEKSQRVEVIRATLQASGLKTEPSSEAISRMLLRAARSTSHKLGHRSVLSIAS